jgi:hypothetical protein
MSQMAAEVQPLLPEPSASRGPRRDVLSDRYAAPSLPVLLDTE